MLLSRTIRSKSGAFEFTEANPPLSSDSCLRFSCEIHRSLPSEVGPTPVRGSLKSPKLVTPIDSSAIAMTN